MNAVSKRLWVCLLCRIWTSQIKEKLKSLTKCFHLFCYASQVGFVVCLLIVCTLLKTSYMGRVIWSVLLFLGFAPNVSLETRLHEAFYSLCWVVILTSSYHYYGKVVSCWNLSAFPKNCCVFYCGDGRFPNLSSEINLTNVETKTVRKKLRKFFLFPESKCLRAFLLGRACSVLISVYIISRNFVINLQYVFFFLL